MGRTFGMTNGLPGNMSETSEVPGTGQTVADLRARGYTDADLATLMQRKPSLGQRFAQGTMRGLARGAGAGLEEEAQPRQGGGRAPRIEDAPPVHLDWDVYDPFYTRRVKNALTNSALKRIFYGQ